LNRLQNSFRNIHLPEQKISSDECLMHIKGRFTIKQYIQQKTARNGLKMSSFGRPKHDMSDFLALVNNSNWMEVIF
jgi:hypothetical protein